MNRKETIKKVARQMMVIGLVGFFIGLGVARWGHIPTPKVLLWKLIVWGGVGYAAGALLGLVMYQFKTWRISHGTPPEEAEKDPEE